MTDTFYLLGAGFSKAIDVGMPTLSDLSEKVWDESNWGSSRLIPYIEDAPPYPEKLSNYRTGNYTHDIGGLLSFLSRTKPWLRKADQLEERRLYTLLQQWVRARIATGEYNYLRSQVGAEKPYPDWTHDLTRHWHDQNGTVATLNYDTLLERVIIHDSEPENEGFLGRYYPSPVRNAVSERVPAAGQDKGFEILKLHGSTNWYKRSDESAIAYTPLVEYFKGEADGEIFAKKLEEERRFKRFVRDRQPFIVPPTLEKGGFLESEVVQHLWQRALDAACEAQRLVCLGYSFPVEDRILTQFLHQIAQRCSDEKQLVPVNFDTKKVRDQVIPFEQHLQSVLPTDSLAINTGHLYDMDTEPNPIRAYTKEELT